MQRRIVRDAAFNQVSTAISALISLFLIPFMLHRLGVEQYGVWVTILSVLTLLESIQLGLPYILQQRVASHAADTTGFAQSVHLAYLGLGAAGALVMLLLSFSLTTLFQIDSSMIPKVRIAFFYAAGEFAINQNVLFAGTLLGGFRRYDRVALLQSITHALRAAGIVVLLLLGMELPALFLWRLVAAAIMSVVASLLIRRVYRLSFSQIQWSALRSAARFSIGSQITDALFRVIYEIDELILAVFAGPSAVALFHIGTRFPSLILRFSWRSGETVFPAASEHREDPAQTRLLLACVMRWILAIAAPACVVLFVLAPFILSVWIGTIDPTVLAVFRISTLAVLLDAFGVGAIYVLWSRGRLRAIARIAALVALANLALSIFFLKRIGIPGVALGTLIPMGFGSFAFVHLACREIGTSFTALLRLILSARIREL